MFPTVDQPLALVLFRCQRFQISQTKKRKPIDTEQGYYFCYMITHTIKVCFTTSSSTCISENSHHQSNGNLHVSKKTRSSTSCKNLDGDVKARSDYAVLTHFIEDSMSLVVQQSAVGAQFHKLCSNSPTTILLTILWLLFDEIIL